MPKKNKNFSAKLCKGAHLGLPSEGKFALSLYDNISGFVLICVGVSANHNRFFPARDKARNVPYVG